MPERDLILDAGALARRVVRTLDDRPLACQLYVTERCNLDCHYCTEYDNGLPHPALGDLRRWIDKLADLGCVRIGLQGGEPLIHPDIVAVVRHCARERGLATSLSTNGFPLDEELVAALGEAGLAQLQISVDRMTPTAATRKALKSIIPKLRYLERAPFTWTISSVLFGESVDETRAVLDYALDHGIPVQARLVHPGVNGAFTVEPGDAARLTELLEYQVAQKRAGRSIRCASVLLDYQLALMRGERPRWTCLAGYKHVFVSARGSFWLCSMKRAPGLDIMDVTPELLRSYRGPKGCEAGCGVYCTIVESLFLEAPARFVAREARDQIPAQVARLLRR